MRARRRFQPSLDSMPMRLAPGCLAMASPGSVLAGAAAPAPTVSPTDALSGSDNNGPSDSPTPALGSFPLLAASIAC